MPGGRGVGAGTGGGSGVKILFVLPQIGSAVPSFHAISILSAVVKRAGHETALLEMPEMRLTAVDEAIARHDPAVVAITSVTQQIPYAKQIIAHVKQRYPDVYTVLGGTHAIVRPHVIDEIAGLDALATNESERPFVDLLSALEAGQSPTDIPNFAFRTGGQIIRPVRTYTCDEKEMTALPFEDRELFPRWKHTPKGVPLESLGIRPRFWISRGCAYRCSFCTVPTLRKQYPEKKFVRYPTAERAIAEIESVADRWTFGTYLIDDDVFLHRPQWVVNEWAKKYPERLKHLKYEVQVRVEAATEDGIRALKETGCSLAKFGLESGDFEYRKNVYDRNVTDERILDVFEMCRRHGLKAHTFNILAGPDETRRQVWRTVRMNQRLKPDRCQISIFAPYPGTPLGDRMAREGRILKHVNNYFEESPIDLRTMRPWEVKLYFRFFRLAVYLAYSPRLAWSEIVGLAKWLRDKVRNRRTRYDLEAATTRVRQTPVGLPLT